VDDIGIGSESRRPFFMNISMDSASVGGAFARGVLTSAGLLEVLELVVDNLKGLGCVNRRGLDLAGV
jgi:hypothetical protein